MIQDTQEYLQHWEKENNPFYPSEMRWDRLQVNRFLKDYKQQLILPVVSVTLPKLQIGDKIKLYGKETKVTGFELSYNDALTPPKYEIILLTTGRGDPFYRSLDQIEVVDNER